MNPPHDSSFQYDDALLSSCASSALASSIQIWVRGIPAAEFDTRSNKHRRDEETIRSIEANRDCRTLYQQYAAHYQRLPLSILENQFWEAWVDEPSSGINKNDLGSISPRIEAFLRSVIFVHQHNESGMHKVSLNRFSDMLSHELPLAPQIGGVDVSINSSSWNGGNVDQFASTLDTSHTLQQNPKLSKNIPPMLVTLHDDETILKFGQKIQSQSNTIDPSKGDEVSNARKLPSMLEIWWRKQREEYTMNQSTKDVQTFSSLETHLRQMSSNQLSSSFKPFSLDKKNKLDGLEDDGAKDDDDDDEDNDTWGRYLNWATEDNPDGVPIVHPAMDQGLCGSCWAISATGTLEASIARSMAYTAYEEVFKKVGGKGHTDEQRLAAVKAAQQIERQAISTADLSVQEIIDCDTRYDQGCAGGNPLFAFYFLHRYGVTSTKNYPYTGSMNKCRYRRRNQPIATVETWGILTADHENNMKKVLRYVGPIAVGLIGADPAFLAYKSGVFFSGKGGKCERGQADHAMLITGYGEEVSKDGDVIKYWIARNSWGRGWGEDGYVRMARIGGRKGHPGVCGIARSPSVALGGMFKKGVKLNKDGQFGSPETIWHGGNDSANYGKFSTESTIARTFDRIQSALHRMKLHQFFSRNDVMIETLNGTENSQFDLAFPFVVILGTLLVCLMLTRMYQKRSRGGRREDVQNRPRSMEESDIILQFGRDKGYGACSIGSGQGNGKGLVA